MPKRLISGQDTKLSRTMHDIRYDAVHDEVVVANPFAQAILTFRGGATGEEPPIRVIQGPRTQGGGSRLDIDPLHDEIFVPGGDSVRVFPRHGNGDVAPIRVIRGPDTQLRSASSIAVDPVNNLIVVGSNNSLSARPENNGQLLIFNRTDNGNVKPLGVIRGPKSGIVRINQIAVYPPRKLVIAAQPGPVYEMEPEGAFVGVWSLDDNGDVPPLWKISSGAKTAMKKPFGVTVNPKHKEIIVSDMRLQSVLTYYVPELF
ncbi:MAG: hypothetical protein HYX72_08590 [Acidobacteria bacterium]|nr:hypothetical protein [Acidobacteriota bacterium]